MKNIFVFCGGGYFLEGYTLKEGGTYFKARGIVHMKFQKLAILSF